MKNLVFLFMAFSFLFVQAQEKRDYFTNLKDFGHGVYAPAMCVSAKDMKWEYDGQPVIFVQLKHGGEKYLLVYDEGPSEDPGFFFYKKEDGDYVDKFEVYADKIFITGTGFVYTAGHTNQYYDKRRKFKFIGTELIEVKQPYYYVGLKTKTVRPIKIYSDHACTKILASLPADYEVEVVAADSNDEKYLVKTSFGLVGWWKLDDDYNGSIKDLTFRGD